MPDPIPANLTLGPIAGLWARSEWARVVVASTVALLTLWGAAAPARAQDLPLKQEARLEVAFECGPVASPPEPSVDERVQADRLASEASEASILGDRSRARGLLAEAVRLDPASVDLAYRYARILEQTGELDSALTQYCRTLALAPDGLNAADAGQRVAELAEETRAGVPDAALRAFSNAVALADLGETERALDNLDRAITQVPEWADAHYNRGVVLLRVGRAAEAEAALARYLELAPDAPDVIAVSQRLGAMQAQGSGSGSAPRPAAALGIGLVPGMGQVYTGRPLEGLAFIALAGAATTEAFLYERDRGRRFLVPGLAIAGTAVGIGALDAYFAARRERSGGAFRPDPGSAFALGFAPGLGQMYSGRTGTGLAFLTLTSGLLAASDLAEEGTDRRFVEPGLIVMGGVWALGAIEAGLHARRMRSTEPPSPWAALGLGLVPGLGQFYAGRTGMGMTVMSVAAAATATSFLYEEGEGRGLFSEGLTVAGVATGLGAIEAYFGARGIARGGGAAGFDDGVALGDGDTRLHGPALLSAGRDGVTMELARLSF